METTAPQIVYSRREKYSQIEPEGRIRRYQYFVRSIVPVILFVLVMLLGSMALGLILGPFFLLSAGKMMIVAGAVFMLLVYWILYNITVVNVTKRCHDFGNDAKLALMVIKAMFAINVIMIIVGVLSSFGILPSGDIGALSTLGDGATTADIVSAMKMTQPLHDRILTIISQIIGIASFILWLFLMFRPGNPGDNIYGKDPINTKVGFLG